MALLLCFHRVRDPSEGDGTGTGFGIDVGIDVIARWVQGNRRFFCLGMTQVFRLGLDSIVIVILFLEQEVENGQQQISMTPFLLRCLHAEKP